MEDDDGFQQNIVKKKKNTGGAVRLYLGGLPTSCGDDDTTDTDNSDNGGVRETDLREWLQQHLLDDDVEIGSIEIKQQQQKNNKPPTTFALVECNCSNGNSNANGINDVIRILKQNSGCDYRGSKVTIQREQRNNNKSNKNKARQRSSNNQTGKRQFGFKNRSGGNTFSTGPSLTARGWSKPTTKTDEEQDPYISDDEEDDRVVTSIDEASEKIASVVSSEISKANNNADDKINAAIASTAATTMMTCLMASMGFGQQQQLQEQNSGSTTENETTGNTKTANFSSFAKEQSMQGLLDDFGEEDPDWKKKIIHDGDGDNIHSEGPSSGTNDDDDNGFASFIQGQSMVGLLADFGEADPDWRNKILDDADAVEDDDDDDKPKNSTKPNTTTTTTASNNNKTKYSSKTPNKNSNSRLAVKGRAPIHLSIESFGFAHGAPSRKSRDRSGSPYTQPMGLLSVGDDVTEPVPAYLEFHDGLRSGVIKRLLKSAPLVGADAEGDTNNNILDKYDDDDDDEQDLSLYKDFFDYCKKYLAEFCIFPSLVEAIHRGGHGYVSPLTMTFRIGSHLGRHRSVVAVERVAQHLRSLLRTNEDDRITCSVSVGTVHRDVNKRIPNKAYREDDEDYDKGDKNDRV